MTIDLLTARDEEACEDFLRRQPGGLLYYSPRFRGFLRELLGCSEETLVSRDGDRITGLLGLMRQKGRFGDVINSLPFFGSNGGILADTPAAFSGLKNAYNELVDNARVASATLIANPLQPADYTAVRHGLNDYRIGQFTHLAGAADDPERFMANFESSTRRNIRKALNSSVQIAVDNNNFHFLEQVHRDNMARIGGKAKPVAFFPLVEQHFRAGDDFNLYVASIEGQTVAALLVFYYNQVVEYYIPVIVEEFRTYQPLALIIFEAMQEAARRGCRLWNWGGTWPDQAGVHSFKKKWGTVEHPYVYYIQVNNEAIRHQTSETISTEYQNFYVIPFSLLDKCARGQ